MMLSDFFNRALCYAFKFIFTCSISSMVYAQDIEFLDKIIFEKDTLSLYFTGSDYSLENIYLSQDTNIYTHQYRHHLLVRNYYGTYRFQNDSLYLECIYNCNNQSRSLSLGSIIIPVYDELHMDTIILSRSDGSNDFLKGQILRGIDVDTLIIEDGDKIYTEIKSGNANYYYMKLDTKFNEYSVSRYKQGLLRNDSLFLDNKCFEYIKYPNKPFIERKQKKKKTRISSWFGG